MSVERPDLDGLRLFKPASPHVWLMFHGRRHRVGSPAVYDALWSEIDGLVNFDDLDEIAQGPDLPDGTCLIRAEGTVFIHLLTLQDGQVRRLFIPTLESLQGFGFDTWKVRDLPPLVVQALPAGPDITAASDQR
jgi:hypothetical protein